MKTTLVYRAVSDEEYLSIRSTGRFSQGPNSLEGKWFADTLASARLHGDALHGSLNYWIVRAEVPDSAPSLFRVANVDGRGPARYLEMQDLLGVRPTLLGGK